MFGKPDHLSGKHAIVTGASSGIGAAIATLLADAGVNLFLVARRKERLLDFAAGIATKYGVECEALALDLSVGGAGRTVVAAAHERYGAIEVCVAAAGTGLSYGDVRKSTYSQISETLSVNLGAVIDLGAAFVDIDSAQHFIAIGSISSFSSHPQWAAYSASKHGLRSFMGSLRQELKGKKVKVSLIHPGTVVSEFASVAMGREPSELDPTSFPYLPLGTADVARAVGWVLCQPSEVDVTELVIRPAGDRMFP